MADLTGIRCKLTRANRHFEDLKNVIRPWARATEESVTASTVENNAEGKQEIIVWEIVDPPPEIPLLLGDLLHNLRCALDHLVCQLAEAAGNSSACEKTQFPIFETPNPDRMMSYVRRHLRPLAADAIEALQPYKRRPQRPTSDNLWLIHELNNIDKHRTLVVVTQHGDRTRIGTKLFGAAFSYRDVIRSPEVDVKKKLEFGMVFKETGVCDDCRVLPTVEPLMQEVQGIVDDFEARGFFM